MLRTGKNDTIVVSALRAEPILASYCVGWRTSAGRLSLKSAAPL